MNIENSANYQVQTSDSRCPECGAVVAGGRDGCQALLAGLSAQVYADQRFAAVYNLAFDTYCMQHVETYCRSAKSYAAHLTRLCCGLEFEGAPEVYAAIQSWLNGASPVAKPSVLPSRGRLTIASVIGAQSIAEHKHLVRAWAEDVWGAYAVQHSLARGWVQAALQRQDKA